MARPDAWMPLYIGDYLADTMHLTAEGHGAYLLLLMHYWQGDGLLPADDRALASIARLSPKRWKRLRSCVERLFECGPNGWTHPVMDALKRDFFNGRLPSKYWNDIRAAIFKRDNYTCAYCGSRGGSLHVDHVVPYARGGDHRWSNLVTACPPCNRAKGAKSLDEWGGRA